MKKVNSLQTQTSSNSSLYRLLETMANGCHFLFLQFRAIGQKTNVLSAAEYVKAYFLLLAFAFLGSASSLCAQCPSGNISFNNQAKVDDFATNFPNCTTINGNVTIGSASGPGAGVKITDLSPLNGIDTITGNLLVHFNDDLTNFNGLSGLSTVGNDLEIEFNNVLTNLNGLSGLSSIANNLTIKSNSDLTNLNGLSGLSSIVNDLTINFNGQLSSCAIPSICNLLANNGTATIFGNKPNSPCFNKAAVKTACFCPPGDISFKNQAEVDDFATDFPNCTAINGNVTIGDAAGPGTGVNITDLSPLNGIATITGDLLVHFNDDLTDFNGLSGLSSIGNDLGIEINDKLTNLNQQFFKF